jgi:hypothetical protein
MKKSETAMREREARAVLGVMHDLGGHLAARRACHPDAGHAEYARALFALGCTAHRRAGGGYESFVTAVATAWEASRKVEERLGHA